MISRILIKKGGIVNWGLEREREWGKKIPLEPLGEGGVQTASLDRPHLPETQTTRWDHYASHCLNTLVDRKIPLSRARIFLELEE